MPAASARRSHVPPGPTNAKNGALNRAVSRDRQASPNRMPAQMPRSGMRPSDGPAGTLDGLALLRVEGGGDGQEQQRAGHDMRLEPGRAQHRGVPRDGPEAVGDGAQERRAPAVGDPGQHPPAQADVDAAEHGRDQRAAGGQAPDGHERQQQHRRQRRERAAARDRAGTAARIAGVSAASPRSSTSW